MEILFLMLGRDSVVGSWVPPNRSRIQQDTVLLQRFEDDNPTTRHYSYPDNANNRGLKDRINMSILQRPKDLGDSRNHGF